MLDSAFEALGCAYAAAQRPQLVIAERAAMLDELAERYDEFMDDADAFVLGICHRFGSEPHLAYD